MGVSPEIHRYIIALAFIGIGILHFIKPQVSVRIMPQFIPFHLVMAYISGVA